MAKKKAETVLEEPKTKETRKKTPAEKKTGIRGKKPVKSFDQDKETLEKAQKARKTPEAEAKRKANREASIQLKTVTTSLIQGDVLSFIRDSLTSVNPLTKKPWYQAYIQKFMDDAMVDPTGKAGMLMASNLFSDNILSKLDAETDKIIARDIAFGRYRLSQTLFDKQREVIDDRITKSKCVICGRRSGKTEMNARYLVDACLQPNTPTCYIHLTFQNGIDQLFDLAVAAANAISLVIVNGNGKGDKSEGLIEFSNGSSIKFRGNANKQESEKIRGYKYRLVIIDEAQSQRNLRYLVEDIVQPLLIDYADSCLVLTGTPPRIPHTYFEAAFVGNEYKSFHWDMRNNPFIPNVEEALAEICRKKGLTMDSPLIQREYLGLIVYDTEALCYKNYKTYKGEPPADFIPNRVYIGVDFGFSDYNAVISVAADTERKLAYVIFEKKFNKATVTEIVDTVRKAMDNAKDIIVKRNPSVDLASCINIFCDSNEKSIAYELYQTYRLPANVAYKYNKDMAIEQLAEWMRNGTLYIPEGGIIADECEQAVHPRDEDTDAILPGYDDEVYHPDALDALLYASRQFAFDIGEDTGGQGQKVQ